jgi:hypothetical protein
MKLGNWFIHSPDEWIEMGVKRMTQRNQCNLICPIRELHPVLFEALEELDPI